MDLSKLPVNGFLEMLGAIFLLLIVKESLLKVWAIVKPTTMSWIVPIGAILFVSGLIAAGAGIKELKKAKPAQAVTSSQMEIDQPKKFQTESSFSCSPPYQARKAFNCLVFGMIVAVAGSFIGIFPYLDS
jgi:hypothetical protein